MLYHATDLWFWGFSGSLAPPFMVKQTVSGSLAPALSKAMGSYPGVLGELPESPPKRLFLN